MARTLDTIDVELARAVTRRQVARDRICALSAAIVADTRFIDLLLAERSQTVAHHQGAAHGRTA